MSVVVLLVLYAVIMYMHLLVRNGSNTRGECDAINKTQYDHLFCRNEYGV